ncbi:hypothetical protein [Carboxylicivirga caseinilyticus]|uniref:hypothetical protein n=1 Tax=Carboxylicivirga caseinilyticus TaxID=3417572 RepID=UPI003D343CB8|nr:PD40 domain-containing protein [Marinilabiliaceae bacterium A049]
MKHTFLLIFTCLLSISLFAQTNYKKRADDYYKYYNYQRALKDYQRLYRKDKDNAELLTLISNCIIKDNTLREEAIPYLEKLLELKPNDIEGNFNFALALYHGHEFEKSENYLRKNESLFASNAEFKKKTELLLNNIQNAKALMQNPVDVSFINLGENINTARNEINPFVTVDEQTLFFSSDKKYNSFAGIYYFNVYVSEMSQNIHQNAKIIGSKVNSIYDEMVAGIEPSGKMLMVYHNRMKEDKMAYANYNGKYNFDLLQDFGNPLDGKGSEFGVWFSTGGDTIVFSGDSDYGDTDLYYAIKLPDSNWGPVRELPGKINSRYNENFPVLSEDGKRIYFSSDNEHSMGGYDLFYSDLDTKTGEWSEPVNMGYPINDTYDNYNISWVYGKRHAYVSAIRPEGLGGRDIYKVVFNEKDPFNYIIKADIRFESEQGLIIPSSRPRVTITDTLNNLVGQYRASADSAKFIMALTPGSYIVNIEGEGLPEFSQPFVIPEKWYNTKADNFLFVIRKKEDE